MRLSSALLIVVLSAVIIFFNLGVIPLLDPDEPVYAETAKEMLQFNDFLSPRIFGEYWYDKPPMYYWLVAGTFKIFGINEFAARFPSALLAVVCALWVYRSGSRLLGERAGLLAALVLVSSIEYFYLAKAAVTDITLTLFLTMALLAFIQKRYYLLYIAAGLATVTKGPVGFLFPGAVIVLYMLCTRNLYLLKEMKIPVGILLFAVVGLPWYILMYNVHGAPFVDTFIGFHNITRFTSPEHPEGVLWYYYIPVLILGFTPWTALLPQALWKACTEDRQQGRPLLFCVIWAVFIFTFFSISQTKLVSYILPMFPPLAMVVGWYLDQTWQQQRREGRLIGWAMLTTLLLGGLAAGAVYGSRSLPELASGTIMIAAIFGVTVIGTWYFIWRRNVGGAFWTQFTAMIAFSIVLLALLFPAAAPAFHSLAIAKSFTSHYDGKSPVYVVKFLRPGFAYYSGVYGIELKEPADWNKFWASGKSYLVVRKPEYDKLTEAEKQKVQVLATEDEKMLLVKP